MIELMKDYIWLIWRGDNNNLWWDNWCGQILANLLQIHENMLHCLKTCLKDILNGNSNVFPYNLIEHCRALPYLVSKVYVKCLKEDKLIWKLSDNGELILKDVYHHLNLSGHRDVQGKIICNSPPSQSLLFKRLTKDIFQLQVF